MDKHCRKCGLTKPLEDYPIDRNRSDGRHSNCKACRTKAAVEWEKKNAEKRRAYKMLARDAAYKEQQRKSAIAKRAADPDKYRDIVRKYQKSHPHVTANSSANRRARKLNATPIWGNDEFDKFVKKEAAFLSTLRQQTTSIQWHVDHIEPLQGKAVSGLHIWNNLQVIPAKLNFQKGNRQAPGFF